jgi:DNA-binding PadR family transcriptional regulator
MTNAELAVMSLLVERPRHGYDVERSIRQRGMREWTDIGFSSIYYLLGKMERAGLVAVTADSPGVRGPSRRIYSPSDAGLAEWQRASIAALAVPATRSPFALGLANLGGLPCEEARAALRERREQLAERLAGVEAKADSQASLAWFVEELFDFSETMIRAEMAWVEGLLGRMEREEEGDDDGEDNAQAQSAADCRDAIGDDGGSAHGW